ncbi:MAG TPA: O-antigen ligase family protein [Bradyrhizobium sp.]
MTAIAGHSPVAALWRWLRDPASWMAAVDVFAILTAFVLPFSTSLTAIFVVAMLIARVPFLDLRAFLHSLRRPIAAVPIAFFALALIGTLWSDAAWGTRFYAVFPTAKLLVLPVLFHHFERSERSIWVLVAFLVSCILMMMMSWAVTCAPGLTLKPAADASRGIFVKNYIDQSQEFTLCAVALAYPVVQLVRARKIRLAVALCAISLSLIANMVFVVVSRTALVTLPILFVIFGLLYLRLRANLLMLGAAVAVGLVAWLVPFGTIWSSVAPNVCAAHPLLKPEMSAARREMLTSPSLEWTFKTFSRDYQLYEEEQVPTSFGERSTYWKYALKFIAGAPLLGHGTGSSKGLFEEAARAPDWAHGIRVFPNPHNQTLNVAIQWGVLGVAVLYAMWLVHVMLFRGEGFANWIGLIVVVQNFLTSVFNSHIFDFHEGWMYVLGVGIAGGMVLKSKAAKETDTATGS